MVTHDLTIAEHAERVISLRDGRIDEDRKVPAPRNPDEELKELQQEET